MNQEGEGKSTYAKQGGQKDSRTEIDKKIVKRTLRTANLAGEKLPVG